VNIVNPTAELRVIDVRGNDGMGEAEAFHDQLLCPGGIVELVEVAKGRPRDDRSSAGCGVGGPPALPMFTVYWLPRADGSKDMERSSASLIGPRISAVPLEVDDLGDPFARCPVWLANRTTGEARRTRPGVIQAQAGHTQIGTIGLDLSPSEVV